MKEIIEKLLIEYKTEREGLCSYIRREELKYRLAMLDDLLYMLPPTSTLSQLHAEIKEIMSANGKGANSCFVSAQAKTYTHIPDAAPAMEYRADMWPEPHNNCAIIQIKAENPAQLLARVTAEFVKDKTEISI